MTQEDKMVRFILGILFGIFLLIFFFQNTEPATVYFLKGSMILPRSLMLLIVFAAGYFFGWLFTGIRSNVKKKKKND
jgi:uncharacterized integral membrane protein